MANKGKQTVLITGCSEGGMGDSLARAFHARGLRVIATARDPKKMEHLTALGIETMVMDVLSTDSIAHGVEKVSQLTGGSLDILLNNSGAGYSMPIVDIDLDAARGLFDLNVWAVVKVTQAFLPLLLQSSGAMIVNHTSSAAAVGAPLMGVYAASKAAIASITNVMRLELKPFGIKVVDLRTAMVSTRFFSNVNAHEKASAHLPEGSIYRIAQKEVEGFMTTGGELSGGGVPADDWAKQVVGDLLVKTPPVQIWRGNKARLVWLGTFLPTTLFDGMLSKISRMDVVARRVQEAKQKA